MIQSTERDKKPRKMLEFKRKSHRHICETKLNKKWDDKSAHENIRTVRMHCICMHIYIHTHKKVVRISWVNPLKYIAKKCEMHVFMDSKWRCNANKDFHTQRSFLSRYHLLFVDFRLWPFHSHQQPNNTHKERWLASPIVCVEHSVNISFK